VAARFAAFGWRAATVEATDHDRIETELRAQDASRPSMVVVRYDGGTG